MSWGNVIAGAAALGSAAIGEGKKGPAPQQSAAPIAGGQQNKSAGYQAPQAQAGKLPQPDFNLDWLATVIAQGMEKPDPTAETSKLPEPKVPQEKGTGAKVAGVLSQLPGADSVIWQLLGLTDQPPVRQSAAPVAGGAGGQIVPGYGVQQPQGFGHLLAQIPRL